jgi:hypothetical protein
VKASATSGESLLSAPAIGSIPTRPWRARVAVTPMVNAPLMRRWPLKTRRWRRHRRCCVQSIRRDRPSSRCVSPADVSPPDAGASGDYASSGRSRRVAVRVTVPFTPFPSPHEGAAAAVQAIDEERVFTVAGSSCSMKELARSNLPPASLVSFSWRVQRRGRRRPGPFAWKREDAPFSRSRRRLSVKRRTEGKQRSGAAGARLVKEPPTLRRRDAACRWRRG